MKASSLKKRTHSTRRVKVFAPLMVDEFHLLAGSAMTPMLSSYHPKMNKAKFLVTQAVVKGKRGKDCFISVMRDAVTGQPWPPLPKKFLPAQVLRRQAQ